MTRHYRPRRISAEARGFDEALTGTQPDGQAPERRER